MSGRTTVRRAIRARMWEDGGSKTAPRQRANAVNPRGLADWIGVDYE